MEETSKAISSNLQKVAHFEAIFPHELESNEWRVKWPIAYRQWKTYNPDYFCPALRCYIEAVTSGPNVSEQGPKWKLAIEAGYLLRVFWWTGEELTEQLMTNTLPPLRKLPRGRD